MEEQDIDARLREIAGRFGWVPGKGLLNAFSPPFDTSKPNLHDSKAEFLEEKRAVEDALEHIGALVRFVASRFREDEPNHLPASRVSKYIDEKARQDLSREPSKNIVELMLKNATDYGLSFVTGILLLKVESQLENRKQELADQEATYWSSPHRAPNHYARTIALRLAKLVARETGQKPTFGTSRDGGHPSTEYGRALEEIFELLGIKAHVRHPAKWAIEQITESDLKPEPVGSLFKLGKRLELESQQSKSATDKIFEALEKPSKK